MKSLRLKRPHAIMMVGIPGSGKSYFAKSFAETFNAPYIDSLSIEQKCNDNKAAGELITMVVNEIGKTNQTFIFEGNADSRVHRTEFARWARSKDYQPLFIWVQTDKATALNRTLRAKSLVRDEFEDIVKGFSAPHSTEKAVVISGKHPYASQVRVVLSHLSKENRGEASPEQTSSVKVPSRPEARSITVR